MTKPLLKLALLTTGSLLVWRHFSIGQAIAIFTFTYAQAYWLVGDIVGNETNKDIVRGLLCRHKHTEIRTVKGGSEGEEVKVLGKFKYCLDCKNNVSGWL